MIVIIEPGNYADCKGHAHSEYVQQNEGFVMQKISKSDFDIVLQHFYSLLFSNKSIVREAVDEIKITNIDEKMTNK